MTTRKIITVFGATGLQGGSVAWKFLQDADLSAQWAVRAVTRDVKKPAAKELAAAGAQVVAASFEDPDSLVKSMSGAYAVFANTNYWEQADGNVEIRQGKNLADAAKEAGVQHFIWSSLLNINKASNGKLPNVYHFDSKATVEEYVRDLGIPATFFLAGFYMSNLASGSPADLLQPTGPDNAWTLTLPTPADSPLPMFHTGDTGKYIKAIVLHRDELLGKRFFGATDYMTVQEVLDTFKRLFPKADKSARHYWIPEEVFRASMQSRGAPEHVIVETYENGRLFGECGYFGGEPLDETHRLVSEPLTTWEEYASRVYEGFRELE
ncbi:hypothetical protein LQW54_011373 [Pestalotiopsis sp. IQ-011]